jgi:hypothetical protein
VSSGEAARATGRPSCWLNPTPERTAGERCGSRVRRSSSIRPLPDQRRHPHQPRLLRAHPHAAAQSDADPITHTGSYADADSNANADPNADSDSYSYSYSYSDPDATSSSHTSAATSRALATHVLLLAESSSPHGPDGGGERSVNVNTEAGCAWTASTGENWIKLGTTSGTGDGEVSYSVEQNTGAERQGTIMIGGEVHKIRQAGKQAVCVLLATADLATVRSGRRVSLPTARPNRSGRGTLLPGMWTPAERRYLTGLPPCLPFWVRRPTTKVLAILKNYYDRW